MNTLDQVGSLASGTEYVEIYEHLFHTYAHAPPQNPHRLKHKG